MSNLSRRKWLKTAALTTTLFAGASSASAKAFDPMPEKWDETFDVVVIGSGFAGLAGTRQIFRRFGLRIGEDARHRRQFHH